VSEENFLSRWSRRKRAAVGGTLPADPPASPSAEAAEIAAPAIAAPAAVEPADIAPDPLPDPATLTPESDFTPFMAREVDGAMRSRALKTLFQDPRFNVMDGLDVYIDDYTKTTPLTPGMLERMESLAYLGDRAARDAAEKLAAEKLAGAGGPAAEPLAVTRLPAEAQESTGELPAAQASGSCGNDPKDDIKGRSPEEDSAFPLV
jgi:hypothetical protein